MAQQQDHSWSLIVLIICWITCCTTGSNGSPHQLHPKFVNINPSDLKYMEFLTGSDKVTLRGGHSSWQPYVQTVLYMIRVVPEQYTNAEKNFIDIKIANLQRGESFKMKIKIKCDPQSAEVVREYSYPFQLDEELCVAKLNGLPLAIKQLSHNWVDNSTFKMDFWIYLPHDTTIRHENVLTFYSRLQFEFFGPKWRLESNGLFLRNWDSIYEFKGDVVKVLRDDGKFLEKDGHLITEAGYSLLLSDLVKRDPKTTKIQFINPRILYWINEASEFVRATIAIGAQLQPVALQCGMIHNPRYSEPLFGAAHAHELARSFSSVQQLDSQTGELYYSPEGVKNMIENSIKYGYTEPRPNLIIHDCVSMKLQLLKKDIKCRYRGPESGTLFGQRDWETYELNKRWDQISISKSNCFLLPPGVNRNRTLFVRDADNYILCPILCPDLSTKYEFFKGNKPLYSNTENNPNSKKFGMFYNVLNTGISASGDGLIISFEDTATNKDEGEYRCTAGGLEAKVNVKLVSLPVFRVLKIPDWPDGSLPESIYAPIGGSYTAKCTVYYLDMKSVTVTPEFYVVEDKKNGTWTKLSFEEFKKRLVVQDTIATMTTDSTTYSTTLTLSMRGIPKPTDSFDFSHRYVCNAKVSEADIKRYGITEYFVQTGTDVVVVTPIANTDINSTMSPCCLDHCLGMSCEIMFTLSPEALNNLKKQRVNINGTFTEGGSKLDDEWLKRVTFDKESGKLVLKSDVSFKDMSDADREKIKRLIPVFEAENGGANVEIKGKPVKCSHGSECSGSIGDRFNLSPDKNDQTLSQTSKQPTPPPPTPHTPPPQRPTSTHRSKPTRTGDLGPDNGTISERADSLIQEMLRAGDSGAQIVATGFLILCCGFAAMLLPASICN